MTVTATLRATGVEWPDTLPDGVDELTATTAEFVVKFDDVACLPASPVAPAVVQATCANGVVRCRR